MNLSVEELETAIAETWAGTTNEFAAYAKAMKYVKISNPSLYKELLEIEARECGAIE